MTRRQNHRRLTPRALAAVAVAVGAVIPLLVGAPGHAALAAPGLWELTGPLSIARYDHTTTLLASGKVLAAAGRSLNVMPAVNFNTAELYDPITEVWTPTGSLSQHRWSHTATLLPDGKVLVTGGFGGTATGSTANAQPVLNSAELYDPATGAWTATAGTMNVRRALHTATLLANGKVLIAGGRWCPNAPPATCDFTFRTATAELYDPATGTFTPTGSMNQARHTTTGVRLLDGRVLVPGGFTNAGNGNTGDVYDPATGTWAETQPLALGRARQGGMLLPDGKVLVALGFPANQTSEVYNPATNTWSLSGNLTSFIGRFNFAFTVLPNGRPLVAGGQTNPPSVVTNRSDVYDPATGQWYDGGPMNEPHGSASSLSNSFPVVVLSASPTSYVADPAVCGRNCGKALVAGYSASGSSELYTPAGTCFGFDATVLGTDDNDSLAGTAGRDVIVGRGGDDRIAALGGDDIVCGGPGLDQLAGGAGNDVLLGGPGADMVSGADGNDFLFGEVDNDQLAGSTGTDTADGWTGTDACSAETTRACP